ncbi:MAG: HD domain-containing protein [Acidimicrobiales bacterium]
MRIGALDLGSNSFHLLVVEARPDGTFEPLVREKVMLRLGDAIGGTGRIGPELADHAVETVRRLRMMADSVGAEECCAMATSALREADDGVWLVERIEASTGVKVQVISGLAEARLIFEAVRASVLIEPGPALALDLGGGSLELMVGDRSGMSWATSVKLGVGRLTAELVRDDPLSTADKARVRKRVETTLGPFIEVVASFSPKMLVGSSGTLCNLACMADAQRTGSVRDSVNQLCVSLADLEAVHGQLLSLTASERQRVPGLDSRRVDLIATGSLILLTAMEMFGFDELTVSEWALREGMVLAAIGAHDPADWDPEPRAIRMASVLGLCRRCNYGDEHASHVAELAVELFDATAALHRLGPDDRELLGYAALLHDIGEHVSAQGHDRHSGYLVQHGRLRGFTPDEVNALAAIARFHRRGTPKADYEPYGALDARWRYRVTRLTALLRVADALDRSHTAAVKGVLVDVRGNRVRLDLLGDSDVELECWALRRKQSLFEQVFHRSVEVTNLSRADIRRQAGEGV